MIRLPEDAVRELERRFQWDGGERRVVFYEALRQDRDAAAGRDEAFDGLHTLGFKGDAGQAAGLLECIDEILAVEAALLRLDQLLGGKFPELQRIAAVQGMTAATADDELFWSETQAGERGILFRG